MAAAAASAKTSVPPSAISVKLSEGTTPRAYDLTDKRLQAIWKKEGKKFQSEIFRKRGSVIIPLKTPTL